MAAEEQEAPIHGDILESILSHVPLIHLLPASRVSKSWNRAVSSSNKQTKPWLIVHTQNQNLTAPYPTISHAYDPTSHVWIEINDNQPPTMITGGVSALRSSHSSLLYMLSPSKLSFSFDPLHLTWHHADAPRVWRTDPLVAVVGDRVVVAGGSCDFEDNPLAVEIYDLRSKKWTISESMPAVLKNSAASTWFSTAVTDRYLFVTEKQSGVTHYFDPENETWHGPYDLRPDHRIFHSVIGFSDDGLILIGLLGEVDNVAGIKLWKVNCESFECEEIGEMPTAIVEKLKSEDLQFSSIEVCLAGNLAYIYKPYAADQEVIVCEFVDDGGCSWRSVNNAVANNRRLVFTCSKVGLEELQRASQSENRRRFAVKL